MGANNPPSKLTPLSDLPPDGPNSAKRAEGRCLLREHEQHYGHWVQMEQKHTERQKKYSSQTLFLLSLIEDLSLSFAAALYFLLQKVQDRQQSNLHWFDNLLFCEFVFDSGHTTSTDWFADTGSVTQ